MKYADLQHDKPRQPRLGLGTVLAFSAWCGLVAGLLEIAAVVIRKRVYDPNQLFGMSRHFVWQVPVTNLCIFVAVGVLGCVVLSTRLGCGRWVLLRLLCALTLLPVALVAFPTIYGLAWLVAALGAATRIVSLLERHPGALRRFVALSFPLLAATVAILGASLWLADRARQARAAAAPQPPAGSPNVVLIVMDTVAAGHLRIHGYNRPTSTTLIELAEHGIRFDAAQAAASWTLPSHATMFTGRWMHELGVGWFTPLDRSHITLAEYLGSQGYSTAGFVANTSYCASDSGLGRGFTEYHDFIFPYLTLFKKAALVSHTLVGIQSVVTFLEDELAVTRVRPYVQHLWRWLDVDRKSASIVNGELLSWLARRAEPERPFFAFLNYFDAHYPYQPPAGNFHRFGGAPADTRQRAIIEHWGEMDKTPLTAEELAFGARAYDDCIADLDEQIGILIDALRARGVLDHTWLIIAADHGESFGEHKDIYCHGTSLYQTELHVPLLVVPPGGVKTSQVVTEAVSLRDLAATIVDLTGLKAGAPFPGQSLARFWDGTSSSVPSPADTRDSALAEVVPHRDAPAYRGRGDSGKPIWPLGAMKDAEWSYIRRDGEVREELFHLRDDWNETHNLAGDPAARPALERMRAALGRNTNGPLVPARFSP